MASQTTTERPDRAIVVLSWIAFHGRSAGLAKALDGTALFPPPSLFEKRTPWRYVSLTLWTRAELAKHRGARLVIVMLPPTFLVVLVRLFVPNGTTVVGDLHSASLRGPKWALLRPLMRASLKRYGALVTNSHDQRALERKKIPTQILHDDLSSLAGNVPTAPAAHAAPVVIFPTSYAADEPIETVIEACKLLTNVQFLFTGKTPAHVLAQLPTNASSTGYLDYQDLMKLMEDSSVVLALTTRDYTMQRAGYEAFALGTPQVTSDFDALREFYGNTAVYCQPTDAESLARAITAALRAEANIRTAIPPLRRLRQEEQQVAYRALAQR